MKKVLCSLITSTLTAGSLIATPQAIIPEQSFGQSAHSEIVKDAIDILEKRFNATIQMQSVVQLSEPQRRNLLLRIYLQSPHTQVPRSVILKQTLSQDSSKQEDDQIVGRFARDWAGLEFLSSLEVEHPITPQFYGGSTHHRFILIEDLGENHVSLVDSLTGGNKDVAKEALSRFVKCLGQLHANGYGKTETYFKILKKIRPQAESQEEKYHITLDKTFPRLESLLDQLHVTLSEGTQSEIAEVFKANFTPGPFTTLIHGDICPDNLFDNRETNELRLIDFEWGFVKSALLDGTYLRMSFPTCWCAKRIPNELLPSLEEAYRQELIKTIPAAANDAEYNDAYVQACAFWMLKSVLFIEDVLEHEENRPSGDIPPESLWKPEANLLRPRVLSRLHAFINVAKQHQKLPQLVAMAEQILRELHTRWPDSRPLDVYPAFNENSELETI